MNSFAEQRKRLVDKLVKRGYLKSPPLIKAMMEIPRHEFVPDSRKKQSYIDSPIRTFDGQTISAPHMNAMMCESLELKPGQKVLEVGTGSGYHAALCAKIVSEPGDDGTIGHVFTIERNEKLAQFARQNIQKLNLKDYVTIVCKDGTLGYEEESPYDRILVTAAGPKIPPPLIEQLGIGGKICIPVGQERHSQRLYLAEKTPTGIKKKSICGVIFVPLIGKEGF
ncbi:MAG: protein-L-isoaspartate(D-aspartate) O-methyltransferase [Candidatus Lokiarchaeota archaeon]|nr:protein-L-isoaspartate(D-aspartate) O-methyltransferase [Candidatus Lokiarchaeota archaeon]